MKLLSVVLLLLPLSLCLAEVVEDFIESCPQFFPTLNGEISPPTGFIGSQYKQICQTLNDKPEFATLYDTTNKIPVYSAYRFTGLKDCTRRRGDWFIEPQLNTYTESNMATESAARKQPQIDNQAKNADYVGSDYDKGHLAPVLHANSQNCSDATFTLTNAAPQNSSFNRGKWKVTEREMAVFLNNSCITKDLRAYVVTGVVPGNKVLKEDDVTNNSVRIPSHFWTAFCCLDQNNTHQSSGGYIGENINNDVNGPLTRQNLEDELNILYGINVTLFGGGC
ncbi:hypothetical protein AMELA_G00228360 [Ameiurus melas]|uniref:Endonuclease domain-containing 1 protein n=1 Tax=Ameiurus melas TaxID=219545 RepID=A0A7J5ZWT8_AMEME|nr:hypothetical protein AMELA_G00228360 [Ameiurus melas]